MKFGAILMSLGYLTLCFGGQPAKPYAMIDGQRYEVVQQGSGDAMKQFVVDNGAQLQIKGNEDKSVSLLAADGTEARKIAPGGFEAQGERNPFYTFLLLIGLALVVIGNGFFKPNISTMVGIALCRRRPPTRCGFHHLLHGHQPRLALLANPVPAAGGRDGQLGRARLVGWLRAGRRGHAGLVGD